VERGSADRLICRPGIEPAVESPSTSRWTPPPARLA